MVWMGNTYALEIPILKAYFQWVALLGQWEVLGKYFTFMRWGLVERKRSLDCAFQGCICPSALPVSPVYCDVVTRWATFSHHAFLLSCFCFTTGPIHESTMDQSPETMSEDKSVLLDVLPVKSVWQWQSWIQHQMNQNLTCVRMCIATGWRFRG